MPVYDDKGTLYAADDGVREDSTVENLAKLQAVLRPQVRQRHRRQQLAGDRRRRVGRRRVAARGRPARAHADRPHRRFAVGGARSRADGTRDRCTRPPRSCKRHDLGLDDLDAWEINEAFAAQVLACERAWADDDFCRRPSSTCRARSARSIPRQAQRRRRRHRARPSGRRVGHAHRAARAERAAAHRRQARHGRDLHRRRPRRRHAGRNGMNAPGQERRRVVRRLLAPWERRRAATLGGSHDAKLDHHARGRTGSPRSRSTRPARRPTRCRRPCSPNSTRRSTCSTASRRRASSSAPARPTASSRAPTSTSSATSRTKPARSRSCGAAGTRSSVSRTCKYPTLALVKGFCLGGGLELALACRYRVVVDEPGTRLGLPEVMLGIVPGWGGIKRLPRLVGAPAALDLLLTGKTIDARRAKKLGIADECVPVRIMESTARGVLRTLPPPRTLPLPLSLTLNPLARRFIAAQAREAGGQARAARSLPGAVRDPRAVGEVRRQRAAARRRRSGVDSVAAEDADRVQPHPRVPAAGAVEEPRQGRRIQGRARARGGRRHDGRRHRRVVRAARAHASRCRTRTPSAWRRR